jgi:hypothetical protein
LFRLRDCKTADSRIQKAGDVWPEEQRKFWLGAADSIFKMIYRRSDEMKRPPTEAALLPTPALFFGQLLFKPSQFQFPATALLFSQISSATNSIYAAICDSSNQMHKPSALGCAPH